ncbi:MAG: OmpP1/FadL family transporter [Thioalkalivibrionaceae bacterium]
MKGSAMRSATIAAGVALALGAGSAHATNGYFAHGYGTQNKGMGGVGMAVQTDGFGAATNPASIAGLDRQINGSLSFFRPERDVEAGPPAFGLGPQSFPLVTNGRLKSGRESFLIPGVAYVQPINDQLTFGLALVGNGGLNTDYSAYANPMGCTDPMSGQTVGTGTGIFCSGEAGVNLEQLAILPTLGATFNDGRVRVGGGPVISYQRFRAKGLAPFAQFSQNPANVSDNGTDSAFAFGGQIGFQADVADGVTVGASYRSKLRAGSFDKYEGLFAEQGKFDVPSSLGLGVAVDVTPAITVSADYQRINYTDVAAISNSFSNLFGAFPPPMGAGNPNNALGGNDGPGFGWRDINVFKIGAQIDGGNGWTYRVGYNRGQNPIKSSEVLFNTLAPGVTQDHVTVGLSRDVNENLSLHFAGMFAPRKSVTGPNALDGQDLTIRMRQYELEVGVSYRF